MRGAQLPKFSENFGARVVQHPLLLFLNGLLEHSLFRPIFGPHYFLIIFAFSGPWFAFSPPIEPISACFIFALFLLFSPFFGSIVFAFVFAFFLLFSREKSKKKKKQNCTLPKKANLNFQPFFPFFGPFFLHLFLLFFAFFSGKKPKKKKQNWTLPKKANHGPEKAKKRENNGAQKGAEKGSVPASHGKKATEKGTAAENISRCLLVVHVVPKYCKAEAPAIQVSRGV